jgi:hypothetical protein
MCSAHNLEEYNKIFKYTNDNSIDIYIILSNLANNKKMYYGKMPLNISLQSAAEELLNISKLEYNIISDDINTIINSIQSYDTYANMKEFKNVKYNIEQYLQKEFNKYLSWSALF